MQTSTPQALALRPQPCSRQGSQAGSVGLCKQPLRQLTGGPVGSAGGEEGAVGPGAAPEREFGCLHPRAGIGLPGSGAEHWGWKGGWSHLSAGREGGRVGWSMQVTRGLNRGHCPGGHRGHCPGGPRGQLCPFLNCGLVGRTSVRGRGWCLGPHRGAGAVQKEGANRGAEGAPPFFPGTDTTSPPHFLLSLWRFLWQAPWKLLEGSHCT